MILTVDAKVEICYVAMDIDKQKLVVDIAGPCDFLNLKRIVKSREIELRNLFQICERARN